MLATEATKAGAGRAAARIGRDVGAIVALAAERVALHMEERRRARTAASGRARDVRWAATWAAAAVGAAASLPSDPILGVGAAALEAGLLAEIETRARARLLAILAGEEPGLLGTGRGNDARRTMFRAGLRTATALVAERAARAGARIVLKELGLALPRLGLRATVGSAAPLVGAAWSAAWNALEMHRRLTPPVHDVDDALSGLCGGRAAPRRVFAHPAIAAA